MRRIYAMLIMIFLFTTVYAQNKPAEKTDPKTENKDATQNLPDGYGSLTWGMYVSDARDKISGILTYTDEKKIIISKDKELEYYYGFFYKEPSTDAAQIKEETTPAADKQPDMIQEKDEGRLFYVSMNFPYLDKDKVYEKIKNKYGIHTGENIKDNQGAIAWTSDKSDTIVIMWIDRYEKKPYCRRIIYISRKISKELNEYTSTIFNKTEIELIKKLNP